MANPLQQSKSYTAETLQKLFHKSRDDKYDVIAMIMLGEDGDTARRIKVASDGSISNQYATQMVEAGNILYLGQAEPGSSTANALWRVRKIDISSGMAITWADGDQDFNNIFDNYASLSYS